MVIYSSDDFSVTKLKWCNNKHDGRRTTQTNQRSGTILRQSSGRPPPTVFLLRKTNKKKLLLNLLCQQLPSDEPPQLCDFLQPHFKTDWSVARQLMLLLAGLRNSFRYHFEALLLQTVGEEEIIVSFSRRRRRIRLNHPPLDPFQYPGHD
jgi:hypothetical protein